MLTLSAGGENETARKIHQFYVYFTRQFSTEIISDVLKRIHKPQEARNIV